MINKCDNCDMSNCCEEFTDCGCEQVMGYGIAIREKIRAEVIDEYKNALLANDVVDKSVVRRIAEQLEEKE